MQYNLNVKLLNLQLDKLKSAIKKCGCGFKIIIKYGW